MRMFGKWAQGFDLIAQRCQTESSRFFLWLENEKQHVTTLQLT